MKKILFLIIIILLLIGGLYLYFYFSATQEALTEEQISIREMYGAPSQFIITYLPRGSAEDPYVVRNEVWYYPEYGKTVTFLAGELVSVDDYIPKIKVPPTSLKPEDFDVFMGYDEVANLLGVLNVEQVDYPAFFEAGEIETYATDKALFIIEQGYLTYFQTLGIGEEELDLDEEPDNEIIKEETKDIKSEMATTTINEEEYE